MGIFGLILTSGAGAVARDLDGAHSIARSPFATRSTGQKSAAEKATGKFEYQINARGAPQVIW
jgi:hypothetical protein